MTDHQLSKIEREMHDLGIRLIEYRAQRLFCVHRASELTAEFRGAHARYVEAHGAFCDRMRENTASF